MRHSYLELTKALAIADFRLRYHGSALGLLWSFLKPLALFGVLFLVFSIFIRFDIENYALHLLFGIVLWTFFAEATLFSLIGLEAKAPLIKKIAFPRTIVVVSSTTTAFIGFLFSLLVFGIFYFSSGMMPSWQALLFLLFAALLYVLALGTAFFVSALFSRFRDVRHIWEVLLQLGFWVTPIIYSIEMIPQRFHFFVFLNPMTRVIEYSRGAVLEGRVPNADGMFALFLMAGVIFSVGLFVYKRSAPYFAERL